MTVTIDTAAPLVSVPDLAAASDSGSSSSDNVTNFTTLTFNGTAEAGASVTLFDGNTVLGSTTASGGNWSITASGLAAGAHSLTARAMDLAGNQTTSSALSVTIDTTAPAVSAPDLTDSSDDGSSNSDNITSITTPIFTGTAEAGALVQLLEGSTVLGSATADACRQLVDHLQRAGQWHPQYCGPCHRFGGEPSDSHGAGGHHRYQWTGRVCAGSGRGQRQRFVQ